VNKTAEYIKRHREVVNELAKELDGVVFTKAPFDIIDKKLRFFEVKVVRPLTGKHSAECRLNISENEVKFGEIVGDKLIYVIIFKGEKYIIPFNELMSRIKSVKPFKGTLPGTISNVFRPCLSKKFLAKYKV
jgi:hypothetical protein